MTSTSHERSEVVFGSDPDSAQFVVQSNTVSRRHARLRPTNSRGEFLIEDLGSSNGTFLNGAQLAAGEVARVRLGDRIGLGRRTEFVLSAEHVVALAPVSVARVIPSPGYAPSGPVAFSPPVGVASTNPYAPPVGAPGSPQAYAGPTYGPMLFVSIAACACLVAPYVEFSLFGVSEVATLLDILKDPEDDALIKLGTYGAVLTGPVMLALTLARVSTLPAGVLGIAAGACFYAGVDRLLKVDVVQLFEATDILAAGFYVQLLLSAVAIALGHRVRR